MLTCISKARDDRERKWIFKVINPDQEFARDVAIMWPFVQGLNFYTLTN